MNAIEMVRAVQRELRLPASGSIAEPHAQLLLGMLNRVQRDLMTEAIVWDELKAYGSFQTSPGGRIYTLTVNAQGEMVDIIRRLAVGNEALEKANDERFRELSRGLTAQGTPRHYRIYGRGGNGIMVELLPVPDAAYLVDAEVLIKPPRLVYDTDTPLLDVDSIILGTIAIAKSEQGENSGEAAMVFQSKMAMQTDSRNESNWGDMEAV